MNAIRHLCVVSSLALVSVAGCALPEPDRAERMTRGYVFYLDGAGGGGLLTNWSRGLRAGLLDAGYDGAGEMFKWETGLGVFADQTASVEFKKRKASELAEEIVAYRKQHPGATVHLMGLSAGTAVAAYALEALPAGVSVQNVVLLSGSLSADYDLSRALRHVDGKLYIFTSQRDEILMALVPFAGTADRKSAETSGTIGVNGARLPRGANSEMRSLYRKVVTIPWNPQFERYGNYGGHTDTVKAAFVQHFVAPLVVTGSARAASPTATTAARLVENPDYRRWSRFGEGSWVQLEGVQVEGGAQRPIRVRVTLAGKADGRLLLDREVEGEGPFAEELTRSFFVTRQIDPRDHPMAHPETQARAMPDETVKIGERSYRCTAREIEARGEFPVWGSNLRGVLHSSTEVPGEIVSLDLQTMLNGKPVSLKGRVVEFHVGRG